jgi:hypothetical protein
MLWSSLFFYHWSCPSAPFYSLRRPSPTELENRGITRNTKRQRSNEEIKHKAPPADLIARVFAWLAACCHLFLASRV